MQKTLFALLISTAGLAAMAQQTPYATINAVEGLVTVTTGNELSNATSGMTLPRGAQVLSTSSGKATIVFANGCSATVQPGQTLLIEEAACATFVAQSGGTGAAAGGGLLTPTNLAIGALGLGVLYDQTRDTPTRIPASGS